MGPRLARTVTTKDGSGNITVEFLGQVVTARANRVITPAVDDVVLITWVSGVWVATAVLGVSAAAAPAYGVTDSQPPPSTTTTVRSTKTFAAKESRSWRPNFGGQWRTDNDDVYQGSYSSFGPYKGCWFYGSSIVNALSGATAVSGTIRVRRISGGSYSSQTVTLRELAVGSRPSGEPSFTNSFTGPSLKIGETESFALPSATLGRLISGATRGLGIYVAGSSPYVVLDGRAGFSGSGLLTLVTDRTT